MKQKDPPSPKEIIMEMYIKPLLPVTEETAKKLAEYFGTTEQYWINLQMSYNGWVASKAGEELRKKMK